jgi:phosphoglycolate phosphatase-like HAD superfamily hydrolase
MNFRERRRNINKEKTIMVFDVDGTLVNTLPHIYESYTKAAKKLKLKPVSLDFFRDTYTQAERFRRHSQLIGVPEYLIDEFYYTVCKFFEHEIKTNKPKLIPGIFEMLSILKSMGVDLRILSFDSPENTLYKVGEDILAMFNEIIPLKYDKMKTLADLEGIGNSFYIGDCVSDGEAAISAGINFIGLVTKYSYSSERKMREFIFSNLNHAFEASSPLRVITTYEIWRDSNG